MAKSSGLGSGLIVGSSDISGDVGELSDISSPRAMLDVTGIDKSAFERVLGRKDGAITFSSFWNTSAGQAHLALRNPPAADVMVTYLHGSTVGEVAASMTAKQVSYAPAFGADGSLVATTNAIANGFGLEWGELLTTGVQSFATGTVNGTSIDLGSTSTLFGAAAYLHVISVASGTAVFTVQDSADNAAFATVTGMVFTGAAGPTTQRLQGAVNATVRRYVRIEGSGTHGAALVVVNFVRYLTDPSV
jgi:hypothetical protein